jgi:heme exporter protein D
MKKNFATGIAGLSVLLLTVYPLLIQQPYSDWLRWRVIFWATSLIALIALALQVLWTMRSEDEQEERERERDKRLQKMAEDLSQLLHRRRAKRSGGGAGMQRAEQAADLARHLMRTITQSSTGNQEFNLFANQALRDVLGEAYSLEGRYYPGEFANVITKQEIRRIAEQLMLSAIQSMDSEESVGKEW